MSHTLKLSVTVEYGAVECYRVETTVPDVLPSDFESMSAEQFNIHRMMLSAAMPAGFSEVGL